MMTSHDDPAADRDPAGGAPLWLSWSPTPAAGLAVDRLAETMRSWRDRAPRHPGLRIGVVHDALAGPPDGSLWTRTAAELAWMWVTAAADSAPARDGNSIWTATVSTTDLPGYAAPLHRAVASAVDRAGLVGTPVTARLLVLITRAEVDPDELAATRAWLEDLRGNGCATVWLCPTTVPCHPATTFPGTTVHLVDQERPYAARMLGAAAGEALDRAGDIRRDNGRTYDASARTTAREFHAVAAQVASALGGGWSAVPYDGGPRSARFAVLRGPGGVELAMIRGRVPGHWHIEGHLPSDPDTGTDPGLGGPDVGRGTDLQSPQSPLVPVGSTPDQVAAEIRDGYLDAWVAYTAAYTAAYAAARTPGAGS